MLFLLHYLQFTTLCLEVYSEKACIISLYITNIETWNPFFRLKFENAGRLLQTVDSLTQLRALQFGPVLQSEDGRS
jgi:hypothetical protein